MKANHNKTQKTLTAIISVGVLCVAVFIMAKGMGLEENLDFGAGAYYYADIPDFDKYTEKTSLPTTLPYIAYVGLFLGWGVLMYILWKWIDKK